MVLGRYLLLEDLDRQDMAWFPYRLGMYHMYIHIHVYIQDNGNASNKNDQEQS